MTHLRSWRSETQHTHPLDQLDILAGSNTDQRRHLSSVWLADMAGTHMIAYYLSMPGVSSRYGKWSGEDELYVVCRPMRGAARLNSIIEGQPYHYDFGDGWRACRRWSAMVRCYHVTGDVARKLRRKSAGFAGYDWMIDEIETYGRIKRLDEQ